MNRGLLIVGVLYGLLAIGYNLATPYGAAPDEGAHLAYVKTLAAGRLPVLDDAGDEISQLIHIRLIETLKEPIDMIAFDTILRKMKDWGIPRIANE